MLIVKGKPVIIFFKQSTIILTATSTINSTISETTKQKFSTTITLTTTNQLQNFSTATKTPNTNKMNVTLSVTNGAHLPGMCK